MEENDRLQKQVSQLVYENSYFRQHTQNVMKIFSFLPKFDLYSYIFLTILALDSLLVLQATLASTDNSCESVVTSGQHHITPQDPPKDASPAG